MRLIMPNMGTIIEWDLFNMPDRTIQGHTDTPYYQ
jgi:hypothetical protein